MTAKALETWTWVLIYGGLLLGSLGVFVLRFGGAWGWVCIGLGALLVVAGAVMIVLRARLPETASQNMPPRKP